MASQTVTTKLTCRNPECRIAETGKCIEGFDPGKCPHFGRAVESKTSASPETASGGEIETIALPSASQCDIAQASNIIRANEVRLNAIVGPVLAGKTSLIASTYDLFQQGPIGNIGFAGSKTLFAFEQACHHSRAVSGRTEPSSERTPHGAFGFYHLCVRDRLMLCPINLLLSDRSGEEYKMLADDPSSAADFVEIRRADGISMLVDGERILDTQSRHNARSDVQMIIQALVDGDVISDQSLAIVLTKLDLIQRSPDGERAQRDFEEMVSHMRRVFGNRFREVTAFRIAASPNNDALPKGYGISNLLRYWIDTKLPIVPSKPIAITPTRAMSRFAEVSK